MNAVIAVKRSISVPYIPFRNINYTRLWSSAKASRDRYSGLWRPAEGRSPAALVVKQEIIMSLQTELDAFQAAWKQHAGGDVTATIAADNEALLRSGLGVSALLT